MQVFGSSELQADVFQKDLCVGCGACVSLCPYFKSHRGKTTALFPCTRPEGRCYAYCPKVEVDLDELSRHLYGAPYDGSPIGAYRAIYAAKAGPGAPKGPFQAGGAVSALMTYALKKKIADAAVLTDREGLAAVPRVVTRAADVVKCASSKYTAAPTLSALNEAVSGGYTKIGVVATPCQALAVAQMRANPTGLPDFIDATSVVVGLFCTWSLDYRAFEELLAGRVDFSKIRKFDIPPPPAEVLEVYTTGKKIEIPLSEVRKRVPNGCSYCFDMTAEFADVSVGVLEGKAGMNTLIVRSERGEALVKGAVKDGYLSVKALPGESLAGLMKASGAKKRRALAKAREEGMINTAEGTRAYLRASDGTIDGIIA